MKFSALPVHSFEDVTLDFEQLQALLTLPAWTEPTLLNSWANFGSGFETVAYLKDALGFVHLKGVLSGGLTGTAAFVLPAGFRPGATTDDPNPAPSGSVQVDVSGNVKVFFSSGTSSLSSITFRAEN